MLTNTEGWGLAVAAISIVWVVLLIRKGPRVALGIAVVLSFAFPAWVKLNLAGLPFDIRTTVLCISLLGYAFHPQGKILSPLTMLDVCIGLLFLTHISADTFVTGFSAGLPFAAYGEWVLPYVAGRFAVRNDDDLRRLAPWIAGVLIVIGLGACLETATGTNLFEFVFGNRPEGLSPRTIQRFGFKRAFGTTRHAIFLGMLLLVLMPWLVVLWQNYSSKQVRTIAILTGLVATIGMMCTFSRTPVLSLLAATTLLTAVRYRVLRWPLGIVMALMIGVFAMFPNQLVDKISVWTGGGHRVRLVEVDGKAVETSSSRSRLTIFRASYKVLLKAGPFGFGSKAVSTFPPQIPYMEGKAEASDAMRIIDNGYILLTLRLGWLGGAALLLLYVTAIISAVSLHLNPHGQLFPAALGCTFFVTATFSMLLIWMSYDFGLEILWTTGILSGLLSWRSHTHRSRLLALR